MTSSSSSSSISARPITLPPQRSSLKIAVVGAGAAGLAAARELNRDGHGVVVYERGQSVGGTWVYTPSTESDPLSLDPSRNIVHSSLYQSLRTNLPRECMGFLDYPFVPVENGDRRMYPGHEEVLRYLEDFAKEFGLCRLVRFGTEVVRVEKEKDDRWIVKSRNVFDQNSHEIPVENETEVFDGVIVCNGHYTEPRLAEISGIEKWPGKQMHSHNYRVADPFLDQVVIIIGSSASAVDISRDIARLAKEVHFSIRSVNDVATLPEKVPSHDKLWLHSMIERAEEDGRVVFKDGSSVFADVIVHCTGYKYHFPFLETNGVVNVDENCVGPLYKHVFPPRLAPSLSFIGLPWKVIPFPLVELQSKWVTGILSGRIKLPTQEEMMDDIKSDYENIEVEGWPKRYAHNLANYQFEYDDWLAKQCGFPPIEQWRKDMYVVASKTRVSKPETYRDEWDDDNIVQQAYEDFAIYL